MQISELLMQALFKVDALNCELESEKQERRDLVKWIQFNLDRVDTLRQ